MTGKKERVFPLGIAGSLKALQPAGQRHPARCRPIAHQYGADARRAVSSYLRLKLRTLFLLSSHQPEQKKI
ncbi:hypothetical protein E2C01_036493 [Portunus trituberculatus]|uniref:Uncharacterized protein n=1 Tax=Portunus trituberculatus TaxID=210409 RepID=A0A5B7F8V4_PORTR|nr:hypothetical protein [Portunus trituberculatus]